MKAACGLNTTTIFSARSTIFRCEHEGFSDCCSSARSFIRDTQERPSKFTQRHVLEKGDDLSVKLGTKSKNLPSWASDTVQHLHQQNYYLKSLCRLFLFCLAETFTPSRFGFRLLLPFLCFHNISRAPFSASQPSCSPLLPKLLRCNNGGKCCAAFLSHNCAENPTLSLLV